MTHLPAVSHWATCRICTGKIVDTTLIHSGYAPQGMLASELVPELAAEAERVAAQ